MLPGKTRRQSYLTMLYFSFFCGKKIRKENSLNNLTTSILSFSSPPARKVTRERKRAPRGGQLPRGWQFSLISRVHWCVHKPGLRDRSLFIAGGGEDLGQNKVQLNRYTLWMLLHWSDPPNSFWWLSQSYPPPPLFIFQANLSDPSSESFRSFQRSRLLGSQLRLIPLLLSEKSSDPP